MESMKKFFVAVAIVASFFVGKYYGENTFYVAQEVNPATQEVGPRFLQVVNKEEVWSSDRQVIFHMRNMLHQVYQYDYNFWVDCLEEGEDFWALDDIFQGDWEDFYFEW